MIVTALLVVAVAIGLMARRVEVRLVLLGAATALGLLAGKPLLVADTFTRAMVASLVAPICAAMGFAQVLAATGCDRHLVHLLLAPLRRAPFLALPGGILAAYLTNTALSSQTSTAATLGPILVPLLRAGGYSPTVAGAALLLGASFGGDLLSPAAQDVQAAAGAAGLDPAVLSQRVVPASLAGMLVAVGVFTAVHRRASRGPGETAGGEALRPHLLRALVPLVPVALLLLAYGGVGWLRWLVAVPDNPDSRALAGALPVVRAMLIGAALAAAVGYRELTQIARSFFDGMGAAYGGIISLTITAQCFGAGIGAVGLGAALLETATRSGAQTFLAAGFPLGLAMLSGSGSGPILTFAQTFLAPLAGDPATGKLAALACLGGALGRTMSPVAAVVVYCAGLTGVAPAPLIRILLPALLAGGAIALLIAAR